MKKLFFTLAICFLGLIFARAFDITDTFYYDTQVRNMYITKIKGDKSTNGAPFLLHKSDGTIVYCIEPFQLMDDSVYEGYYGYNDQFGISEEAINKMNIIAHYGYGYENHTDLMWYGLTQYLIWEQIGLDDMYFTDTFKGNRIEAYQNELNEIRELVSKYSVVPSFDDEINLEKKDVITLTDTNNVLSDYDIVTDLDVRIENNNIIISNAEEGTFYIDFIKKDSKTNYELYYSSSGQDIIVPGHINDIKKRITLNIKKGTVKLTKKDRETEKSRSNLTFEGTIYGIYDINENLVKEVSFSASGTSDFDIPFGSYYAKEIKAPVGYKLDDKKYYFDVDFNNNSINLDVYDDVIKKNITIYKLYGNKKDNIYSYEEGATFEIYDEFNNLVGTYQTNSDGIISVCLPYGNYTIHQISTKEGYDLADDYKFEVKDEVDDTIKLYDYEQIVEVPDTYKDEIDYKGSLIVISILFTFNVGIYAYRKDSSNI